MKLCKRSGELGVDREGERDIFIIVSDGLSHFLLHHMLKLERRPKVKQRGEKGDNAPQIAVSPV